MNPVPIPVLNHDPSGMNRQKATQFFLAHPMPLISHISKLKKMAVSAPFLVNDPFSETLFPGTLDIHDVRTNE